MSGVERIRECLLTRDFLTSSAGAEDSELAQRHLGAHDDLDALEGERDALVGRHQILSELEAVSTSDENLAFSIAAAIYALAERDARQQFNATKEPTP